MIDKKLIDELSDAFEESKSNYYNTKNEKANESKREYLNGIFIGLGIARNIVWKYK